MRTALTLLLLAGALLAQDLETKYHEAYVLEVVDGDVKGAARAYLDLLREKELPPKLAAQCRFRLAVTFVLLGRADEARARLAALASEPGLADGLRKQIDEYRRALQGVHTGSAFEKRMEELTFQLGRASEAYHNVPHVYRDFQIIGDPAVPYLKQLLQHRDRALREHAFRILCRMDVPGLAALWSPKLSQLKIDFPEYLSRHPAEVPVMEKRVAELNDYYLKNTLNMLGSARVFGAPFLEKIAQRDAAAESVAILAWRDRPGEDILRLFRSWMATAPDGLANGAARLYLGFMAEPANAKLANSDQAFLLMCPRLAGQSLRDNEKGWLYTFAGEVSAEALLGALARLVEMGESWKGGFASNPLANGIADRVAIAIDGKIEPNVVAAKYAPLLKRWLVVIGRQDTQNQWMGMHLRRAVTVSAPEAAADAVRELFSGTAHGKEKGYLRVLGFERPEDGPLIRVALEAASPHGRYQILKRLMVGGLEEAKPEFFVEVAALYAELPRLYPRYEKELLQRARRIAVRLPTDHARAFLRALMKNSRDVMPLFDHSQTTLSIEQQRRYRVQIAGPLLAEALKGADADTRRMLVSRAGDLLLEKGLLAAAERKQVGAFVTAHLDALHPGDFHWVAKVPDAVPLEAWVPFSHTYHWNASPMYPAAADDVRRATRYFADHPEKVNGQVLHFLRHRSKSADRRAVYEKLIEKNPALLARAEAFSDMSPDQIERAMAAPDLELSYVGAMASLLADRNPSAKLVPVVRRLLQSDDRETVRLGIKIARKLGSEELVDDLMAGLDSLDQVVRDETREALNSILDLRRIKQEVRDRVGSRKPPGWKK